MSPGSNRDHPARVLPLSRLEPRPVEWLWPGRLALGKLAMIDDDPDQGKSLASTAASTRPCAAGRPRSNCSWTIRATSSVFPAARTPSAAIRTSTC
jgi:hypothetical protein